VREKKISHVGKGTGHTEEKKSRERKERKLEFQGRGTIGETREDGLDWV
jgi:hypothetical protein